MKVYVHLAGKCSEISVQKEKNILEILRENEITVVPAFCGGKGTCGKCLVKVREAGKDSEEKWVLACQTKAEAGMHIFLKEEKKASILEKGFGKRYAPDGTVTYAAACDIGTTTVVCHLLNGKTGEIIASLSAENAQKIYGADVISRIQASEQMGTEPLQNVIVSQIRGMLEELCEQNGIQENIGCLAVVGNTVMCHLFAGISPVSIGTAPFIPQSYFGVHDTGGGIGIARCNDVYIAPAVSGYIGGDITADLLAVLDEAECVEDGKEQLLIDIGTNGELVLGKEGDFSCCAAAAGPAFEGAEITMGMPAKNGAIDKAWLENGTVHFSVIGGGEAIGICGSGLVDILSIFLETELMDESGGLCGDEEIITSYGFYVEKQEKENGIRLTEQVWISQSDIRKLQLAKAAIAAGIEVLLKERKKSYKDIGRVILAGGFGTFLNKENAAAIGLIPRELLSVTEAVGNAAGEGAVSAALSEKARKRLNVIKSSMKYIELSTARSFSDMYVEKMFF